MPKGGKRNTEQYRDVLECFPISWHCAALAMLSEILHPASLRQSDELQDDRQRRRQHSRRETERRRDRDRERSNDAEQGERIHFKKGSALLFEVLTGTVLFCDLVT